MSTDKSILEFYEKLLLNVGDVLKNTNCIAEVALIKEDVLTNSIKHYELLKTNFKDKSKINDNRINCDLLYHYISISPFIKEHANAIEGLKTLESDIKSIKCAIDEWCGINEIKKQPTLDIKHAIKCENLTKVKELERKQPIIDNKSKQIEELTKKCQLLTDKVKKLEQKQQTPIYYAPRGSFGGYYTIHPCDHKIVTPIQTRNGIIILRCSACNVTIT